MGKNYAEPKLYPRDMIVVRSLLAAWYVAIAGIFVGLTVGSQVISPTASVMIGGGLVTAVVPQILRRTKLTLFFLLPFIGGVLLTVAAFLDAFSSVFRASVVAFAFAAIGLAMTLAGLVAEAVGKKNLSVWMWREAWWGVEMPVWTLWNTTRRWLSILLIFAQSLLIS